mmetsp:Transcript_13257/g.22832  ORF Transcript_13257/g.22832 Transcript_13257/m.22832 type:complete len:513 (+) Transcript_13257:98-1636(+)|eukprot:CAMPEP_0196659128 /NCGR_PEP_ID=MMETSP1086-20130531/33217_1 /TAXON_ID=77921 /ORGANISM="Cyanoptyche  gloeocystis , Strain SAG4.97" /LENGTH=512 /DNA_ID=CAMNT_0041992983 /DNA_START=96 /DNA_END=1634 /DNA_ORIENTATION=+
MTKEKENFSHMSITSDEINYLVYRYLQESGFLHSAFTFSHESLVHKSNIKTADVPTGALISYLQRGLQYTELESHLAEDGSQIDCDESFSLLCPHKCVPKEKKKEDPAPSPMVNHVDKVASPSTPAQATALPAQAADVDMTESSEAPEGQEEPVEISDSQVLVLQGHSSEVFICSWNPTQPLLASGSGDSTARIWSIGSGPRAAQAAQNPIVLKHYNSNNEKSKDVTTLDWNGDGTLLATGSYDGQARIWNYTGELKSTLNKHKGPIFSLKWNKKGDLLLSGSVDKTAIVWDAKTGDVRQQFEYHTAPTLDVDWRNNNSFATCSTDKMIFVCKIGDSRPLKQFTGHQDEVNAIKWDPTGQLLASCSDDYTAKIWSTKQDRYVHDFREHTKEIYTIKWSPTGPGTVNPNQSLVLASASFDASIKLWDVERGACVHSLTKHSEAVYSVGFSPNGLYLASGSFDRCLHIWSVKDGSLVKTYRGSGGIFEVCWNSTGDKVAACFSNNTVAVLDFRV